MTIDVLTAIKNGVKACRNSNGTILGDPGADNGAKGKSQRAGKYGKKKSKERPEEPLGIMSYQTSSRRSPPFWLLIGARKLLCFSAQSEARMAATFETGLVRHCPQGLFWPFFPFLRAIFSRPFRLSLALTICRWVSEDGTGHFARVNLLTA